MATGVQSWSKTAATNATADSNVNWAEGMAPSAVNDSSRGEMASVAKWRDDIGGTLTTGGTSTAFTLTTNQGSPGSAALMSGMMYCFIPHATSGAAPTLAVDGLTARAINQSTGVAVPTGALLVGTPYVVTYIHATTEFIVRGVLAVATVNDPLQVLSVDAGAGVGPTLDLYRNSASPAASDFIGSTDFNGRNSTPAKKLYARIIAQITNATAASEAAVLLFQQCIAGTLTTILSTTATAISSALILTLSNVTNALSLAGGTTGQRNGSPTAGDTRYNTTLSALEFWNGTLWVALGKAPTIQAYGSGATGTHTPTPGTVRYRVRMCGGGGGGGARTTNSGGNGGDTTFASWTAKGGVGGTLAGAGGAGGTTGGSGTGTQICRFDGQSGGVSTMQTDATGDSQSVFTGGAGGSTSFFGGGGAPAATTGGTAKANTGGGGAGGNSSVGTKGGGGGGSGEYVEFWVEGSAAVSYACGAAGTAGAAGGSGGGAGASGVIIVEEYYA